MEQEEKKKSTAQNIRPLFNLVLIEPITEEVTEGGIILPKADESKKQGKVLRTGPGKGGEKMQVQQDATVIYHKYSGTDFETSDGRELLFVPQDKIFAVIE